MARPTSEAPSEAASMPDLVPLQIEAEVRRFLTYEARLLDGRHYSTWLQLFTEDVHYWMPNRTNQLGRELEHEFGGPDDVAFFDEHLKGLQQRVTRLETGMAWAEDPPSRTRHLITNVWVADDEQPDQVWADSDFLTYRHRGGDEVDIWVGRRHDLLVRLDDRNWRIRQRTIYLDQTTLISRNLSVFF